MPNQVLGFSDAKLLDQPEHGFDPVDPVDDYIRWRHHLAVEAELNTKRGGTLILVAHDHGYLPELRRARSAGLNVYLVGFLEMPKTEFLELKTLSAKLLDLEFDLKAFNRPLPNRPRESVLRAIINRTSPHVRCDVAAGVTNSDFLRSGEKDMHAFAETWRGRKRHSKSSEHPVLSANANPVNGGQPYLVAAEVRRLILDSGK